MTVFKVSSKQNFLSEVMEMAIKLYGDNFSNLKIILPSGIACNNLQKMLVQKFGSCILPDVISLSEITINSEEIFKIPSDQVGSISRLEEKITLAEVIHEYKKLNYDQIQCLRLAPSLANLFYELEANNINIEELKNLPVLDQPEHWFKIYDFLVYSYTVWNKKIIDLKKTSRALYQKMVFDSELKNIKKNPEKGLIMAGICGNNLMSNNFIQEAIKLDNCHIILLPFPNESSQIIKNKSNFSPDVCKLIQLIEDNHFKTVIINKWHDSIVDKLIMDTDASNLEQHIDYIKFENIFHEAEYIALKCNEIIAEKPNSKIAIITHDQQVKEQYSIYLEKYNLTYQDQFGHNILQSSAITLITLIAEQIYCPFNLKKFFSFLSHPLINCILALELKKLVRKKNRFAPNMQVISNIVRDSENSGLIDFFSDIQGLLENQQPSNKFNILLKQTLSIAEKLVPNIWISHQEIVEPLMELCQLKTNFLITNVENFSEILKQTLNGGRIFVKSNSNITIANPNSIALINYDYVFITDMNEGSYPSINASSPWINNAMQKKLKLTGNQAKMDCALYDFYLNIQNKNVILTRSKRDITNKKTLPSPFILNLKYILGDKFKVQNAKAIFGQQNSVNEITSAKANIFPNIIYATDVETLIRAPYNFYLKKILKLRKIDEINEYPNLADFGNFFHNVMDNYTKNYQPFNHNKQQQIIDIADSILLNSNVPIYSKKDWRIKITAMSNELIAYDEMRRKKAVKIYSEITGSINLDIKGNTITLKSIADRIEINSKNQATIMDFKTGAIPATKDILSGLSPQMLVEAIILADNGFGFKSTLDKIIYIKINSSKPYIKTTELVITPDEIMQHKQGLIKLIEHYIDSLEFLIEPSTMKYDDYKHMARRI
ncbi:MAG: hypothetical protein EKK61_02870 [Rickettsiales bacterium]|nr:MAG: hypothetical protein EKK61_02870 [Rickettsiales bacterium]